MFRARLAVLAAGGGRLEELLGYVAAEANHENDRLLRKRLDQAFQALKDIVEQP